MAAPGQDPPGQDQNLSEPELRNGVSLRGGAYETLRNGVRPPNLCFLNARDQLYVGSK